jgi:hypothetical protein
MADIVHCPGCRCEEIESQRKSSELRAACAAKIAAGTPFTDDELRYSAYARCECGAGMAYPKDCPLNHYWDCSAILKGEAPESGQSGAVKHSGQMPFAFYEVKSEYQPNANGATTRPQCVTQP